MEINPVSVHGARIGITSCHNHKHEHPSPTLAPDPAPLGAGRESPLRSLVVSAHHFRPCRERAAVVADFGGQTTLNAEAQRIAIAEACGWSQVRFSLGRCIGIPPRDGKAELSPEVPRYLSDLNAAHEMEKVLKDDFTKQDFQVARYVRHIENGIAHKVESFGWSFAFLHATAAQRAEAFLRTLNLWDDNK